MLLSSATSQFSAVPLGHHLNDSTFVNVDLNMVYGSIEHLIFVVLAIIFFIILYVLPTLLLILYPFGLFRSCLSKCKLDSIALYIFVKKFYSCYRDGLNGRRDMRSFAGLYFVVRLMLFLSNGIGILLMVSDNDPFFTRNVILSATLLLVGLCRPYKKTHMIVFDVLLLAHMGLFCHLASSSESFTMQNRFVLCAGLMLCLPFVGFVVVFIVRGLRKIIKN